MTDMTMSDSGRGVIQIKQQPKLNSTSIWHVAFRRFIQHRMAVVGVILLSVVIVYCVGGAMIYSEKYANDRITTAHDSFPVHFCIGVISRIAHMEYSRTCLSLTRAQAFHVNEHAQGRPEAASRFRAVSRLPTPRPFPTVFEKKTASQGES